MQHPIKESPDQVTTTVALAVAPAAAGAGIGILLAEALDRDARRAAGVVLIGVAVLAALPWFIHTIGCRVAGPRSRRGAARTLQKIRDGAIGDYSYESYNFDEIDREEATQA